jgi:hypothetical protein
MSVVKLVVYPIPELTSTSGRKYGFDNMKECYEKFNDNIEGEKIILENSMLHKRHDIYDLEIKSSKVYVEDGLFYCDVDIKDFLEKTKLELSNFLKRYCLYSGKVCTGHGNNEIKYFNGIYLIHSEDYLSPEQKSYLKVQNVKRFIDENF